MRTRTGELKLEGREFVIKSGDFEFRIPLSVQQVLKIMDVIDGKVKGYRVGKKRGKERYLLEVFVPEEQEGVVVVGKVFEGDELRGKKSFLLRQGRYVLKAELKEAIRKYLSEGGEIKRFVSPLYYSLSQRGLYLIWKDTEAYIPRRSLSIFKEVLSSDGTISFGKVKVENGKLYVGDSEVDEEHVKEIKKILEFV